MITTIDKAGRLVVPKPIRDAMGLTPEIPVDITYADGRIVIEFAPVDVEVLVEGGLPVIRMLRDAGTLPLTDEDVRETLEAVRSERVAQYL